MNRKSLLDLRHAACALVASLALLAAGPAAALDPPKVVVDYSLEIADGGSFILNITATPIGTGWRGWMNPELPQPNDPVDPGDCFDRPDDADCEEACSARPDDPDCSAGINVVAFSPATMTIEYTADPQTGEIVDGPVELVDYYTKYTFQVFTPSEDEVSVDPSDPAGIRTTSDIESQLVTSDPGRRIFGTLSGDVITWDPGSRIWASTVGQTICEGDLLLCAIACADQCPWPRIEDGVPTEGKRDLPKFTVFSDVDRGDGFISDNETSSPPIPEEFDDILQNQDNQATTYNTLTGAEFCRQFHPPSGDPDPIECPEPAGMLLAGGALLSLALVRRSRRG